MINFLSQLSAHSIATISWLVDGGLRFVNNSANVISVCAFWIAWQESRRGSSAIVRVTKSAFHFVRDLEGDKRLFEVRLKNNGISLHDVTVDLVLKDVAEFGELTIRLLTKPGMQAIRTGEFARGMVAEFVFQLKEMRSEDAQFFKMIAESRVSQFRIRVNSQGFSAVDIAPRHFLLQFSRDCWNRFAIAFNDRFGHRVRTARSGRAENVLVEHLARFDSDFDWAASQLVEEFGRAKSGESASF